MRKYLPCLAVLVGMAVASSTAAADPNVGPKICPSAGKALSGSVVGNLTITGDAYVPAGSTLTVRGNLTLAAGSCFDAFTVATVVVKGAVNVGKGAVLGLGCSPGAIGPEPPCEFNTTEDIVGGGHLREGTAHDVPHGGESVRQRDLDRRGPRADVEPVHQLPDQGKHHQP